MAEMNYIEDIIFGCLDPLASNYNPDANTNDASVCEYYQSFDLKKEVYGANDSKENLDTNFKELNVQNYTIKQFFKLYNELFYEVPKKGLLSHNTIVSKSKKYIGNYEHPRNKDILALMRQMKDALFKFYSIPDRHSIVRNNSVLISRDTKNLYYVQSFKRRHIPVGDVGVEIISYIKEINGYNPDADIAIPMSQTAINLIPQGPPIGSVDSLGDNDLNLAEVNTYAATGQFSVSNEFIVDEYSSLNSDN
jgi:hypothetical protein